MSVDGPLSGETAPAGATSCYNVGFSVAPRTVSNSESFSPNFFAERSPSLSRVLYDFLYYLSFLVLRYCTLYLYIYISRGRITFSGDLCIWFIS